MIKEFYNFLPKNIFTEQAEYLQNADWKFWGYSNPSENKLTFWFHDLIDNDLYTNKILNEIKSKIGFDFTLTRVYANGQTHGLCGEFHYDDKSDNSYTLLIYMNEEWNPNWGGHTIISSKDKIYSIVPEPNKALLFNGNLLHAGLEPTRYFTGLRVTVAFKLLKI
jgi:hypothetical protein